MPALPSVLNIDLNEKSVSLAQDVAETMEKQGQKEEAVEFYIQAAELFAGEEQTSEARNCRLKVRFLHSLSLVRDLTKAPYSG